MQCPKCGGAMWDNRQTKKNPKQPDYKCKNKMCIGDDGFVTAIWVKDAPAPVKAAQANGSANGTKWTWAALSKTYGRSLLLAEQALVGSAARTKLVFTPADVLAATATIFIAASRDGVSDAPKKVAAPPPAPKPEPVPEPVAVQDDDDDSDLPF